MSKYELSDLGDERGVKVWSGELATATTLNQDVTTAFPVDQALGDLQPGVYVMTAEAKGPGSDSDGSLATQWFIVSDLGLTAFSGNDGIHVFVNSLASTEAVAKAEVRLVARNNEILATRKTDESGHVLFEAGLARGEGGLSPAMLTVSGEKTDYAFLSLKSNAFDLSDRGVSGRAVPAGADAFVYAERGVYRSSETVYLTALLRDGQGNAVTGGPLTLVIERPDGVEFRRAVLPDQGAGGRSMALTLNSAVPTGTWRARAFTDPKGSSVGETTFMVEDYIPERIEFELTAKDKQIKADVPVELKVDGRFLYGAPASGLQLEGDMLVAPAVGTAGFCRLPVRRRRRGDRQQRAHPAGKPARGRRQGRRDLPGQPGQTAVIDPSAGSPDLHPDGGSRRPLGRTQAGSAGRAGGGHDRGQTAVRRQERRRRRQGRLRRRVRARPTASNWRAMACATNC